MPDPAELGTDDGIRADAVRRDVECRVDARHDILFLPELSALVEPKSLLFLNGTVLDYDTNLVSQGFRFNNPNAKATCGCGSSFGA